MPTTTIYVSRIGNSTQLCLRDTEGHNPGNDNLTTDVRPGDTIMWQLDPSETQMTLMGVYKTVEGDRCFDSNSLQLLNADPVQVPGGFKGTVISQSPGSGRYENYKIAFTIPGNSKIFYDDPKLQMNV